MFEQAVLRPTPVRGWAVSLAVAGEVLLVGCVLVMPLIWPRLLPRGETMAWIQAPTPPPAELKPAFVPRVRATRSWPTTTTVYLPVTERPVAFFDEPPAADPGPGVKGSDGGAPGAGLKSLFDSVMAPAAPKQAAEPAPAAVVRPGSSAPQAIRVSSSVQAGRLVHRVQPEYPALARQMRIAGTVELDGVIGTDGRIRELRVTSGHPFLAKAALDAVRQWVYQPTLLSGVPVEVITTITVIFRLN